MAGRLISAARLGGAVFLIQPGFRAVLCLSRGRSLRHRYDNQCVVGIDERRQMVPKVDCGLTVHVEEVEGFRRLVAAQSLELGL